MTHDKRILEQADRILMSFGHALAQVAVADGRVDDEERNAIADALETREVFNGPEVELVVESALAQAGAWQEVGIDDDGRSKLADALYEGGGCRQRGDGRRTLRDRRVGQ